MRPFSRGCFGLGVIRLAVIVLLVAIGAMGIHALIHFGGNGDSGQQCQICYVRRAAAPLPADRISVNAPLVFAICGDVGTDV